MPSEALPYCGPPPVPADLARHWNFDPVLLLCGLGALACYELAAWRTGLPGAQRRAFHAGAGVALAAWISPLCALGVALFGARVAQHMVLALVAAPLLARAWPAAAHASVRGALAACGAYAAATWLWHAPGPYEATFRSDGLYWTMHSTSLGAAVALWRVLLRRGGAAPLVGVAAAALTSLQMGLLGALFTFAPAPLLESHLLTAAAFGLTPLEDQQLGGLVLWIPGCGAFLLFAAWSFAAWLRDQEPAALSNV